VPAARPVADPASGVQGPFGDESALAPTAFARATDEPLPAGATWAGKWLGTPGIALGDACTSHSRCRRRRIGAPTIPSRVAVAWELPTLRAPASPPGRRRRRSVAQKPGPSVPNRCVPEFYDCGTVHRASPPHSFIASSDGVIVAVHDLGGPDDPAAPVLLFSHATGLNGRVWEPMAAGLSSRFRCQAIDFRGHGLAESPEGMNLAWSAMADDIVAVLDSTLIGPDRIVHGIGHSMGGAALLLASARRPSGIRSLWLYEPIVVKPTMQPPFTHSNPMADAASRRRASFPSFDAAFDNFASKPPLNQLDPEALRGYVDGGFILQGDGTVSLRCSPATEAAVFRGAHDSGAWDVLAALDLPVAVVRGRHPEVGLGILSRFAVESLSRATLFERPHLGHFGPLEDPSATAKDVVMWVESIS